MLAISNQKFVMNWTLFNLRSGRSLRTTKVFHHTASRTTKNIIHFKCEAFVMHYEILHFNLMEFRNVPRRAHFIRRPPVIDWIYSIRLNYVQFDWTMFNSLQIAIWNDYKSQFEMITNFWFEMASIPSYLLIGGGWSLLTKRFIAFSFVLFLLS